MFFDVSDEQIAMRHALRALLQEHSSPTHVRDVWNNPETKQLPAWKQLSEMGAVGMLVPEESEGTGQTWTDATLVAEECGYHAVVGPVIETMIAGSVLSRFGSQQTQDDWLPGIADGRIKVTVALSERGLVNYIDQSDAVLLQSNGSLYFVRRDYVSVSLVDSMDPTLRTSRCRFNLADAVKLNVGEAALRYFLGANLTGTAAFLVGLCQRLIDETKKYALERTQFDRPIGSFQAVKHHLANVALLLEAARSLVWRSACELAESYGDKTINARLAKSAANRAAHAVGYAALQLHGGIGFTWEHDLHLWLQRAKSIEPKLGSESDHLEIIADEVLSQMW